MKNPFSNPISLPCGPVFFQLWRWAILPVLLAVLTRAGFAQSCTVTNAWGVYDNDVYNINTSGATFTQTAYTNVLPVNTYANAFNATTGIMYVVTSATSPTNPILYRYNTATPAVVAIPSGCTLPTINAASAGTDTYYLSGGQDAAGNLYFSTYNGRLMVKVNPTTCTNTILWSASTPLTTVGPDFYSGGGKNFTVDANGDFIFVDAGTKIVYTVPATGVTATARGALSGLPASYDISDIFFVNGNPYVTSTNLGVYRINPATLAAITPALTTFDYQDIATASCTAGTLPALPTNPTCPPNTLYALNSTGNQINKLDATTYSVLESYTPAVNAFSLAFSGVDGKLYYVTNAANPVNPPLYVFDPATNLTYATGCTLPTIPSGSGTYYISGGSDASGNLYFTSSNGQAAYRINPTSSCSVTTLWTASTLIDDPQAPYNNDFTNFKDVAVDASGTLIFVDDVSPYALWSVNPTTRQVTYRGNLTGIGGNLTDVYFQGGNLFVSSFANGTYQVNMSTLAATPNSSYNSVDMSNPPCEAGTLPALSDPVACPPNVMYTSTNANSLQQINATTFAPTRTYSLPFNAFSVAWPTDGRLYTVTTAANPVNPPIYAVNPVTGSVYSTSCTLPTLSSNRYYISGTSDAEGNIYFSSDHGHTFVRVNPATCAQTILWNNTTIPSTGAPAGVSFTTEFKDVSIDGNGDYYFIDDAAPYRLWQVKKGTATAIYRGALTGVSGSISDIVFNAGKVYVTTSLGSSGVYEVNPTTYAATLVPGTSSYAYTDASSAVCQALPLELRISGNILDDGNGLTDGIINTSGTGAQNPVNGSDIDPVAGGSQPIYATLVNSTGTAVKTAPVNPDGTYSFTGVIAGTYSIVLSTNPAGSTTPSLPASWTNVGENVGTGSGSDGTPNGILTGVSITTANVTSANFGIDKVPVVNPATVTAQTNPGGTNQAPVASTAFTGSDLEDGTYPANLTGRTVTLSPATNGTLYYNGNPVTSPTAFTGFDPTKVTLDPTAPGATTGNDPTFTYAVADNAGIFSTPATVTVPFTAALVSVSGSVLDDGNGLTDATVNTTGTGALSPVNGTSLDGTPLYATLVNSGGSAVQTVAVTATGSYSFPGVAPGTYSVVLSTNPAGSTTASLPTSWTNVGENVGTGSGSDGTPNGILTGITVGGSNVVNANFGIDKAPVVSPATVTAQANPGGTSQAPVSPTAFTGSDLEDGTYPANLTGRTVTLSPATNGTLYYNGTPVTSTTAITGFDPTKVTLDPTAPGATTGNDPTFTYAVKDNAGVLSPPATVTVPFTAALVSVSGSVLDDGNGLTDATVNTTGTGALSPVNGTSLDGTPLYATLVNSGGSAVQTVAVTATGTYSFPGVSPGTYSVVLSTNSAGSTTASLPTSWTNVGENVGPGAGSDGTPNGILTGITVGGSNVVNANFGIDKAPVVNPATVTAQTNPGGTNQAPVSPTAFTGSDQEDGTYPNNLTGRTVTLSPATNGTLYYNGTPVTSTTAITGFDPTKVTLDPTAPGATTGNDPTFTYAVADNAGVLSPPATVTVPFTAALLLSGTVFSDPNGLTNGLVDGTPTNVVNGNTFYVSTIDPGTGNVLATTAVAGNGTYSLPVTANTSYSVVLSNAPQTVGTPVSATLLTGAVNTGEGTAPGGDGTPNGQTPVSVVTSNVAGVNFGVEVPPTATSTTLASQPNPGGTNPIVVPPASFAGTDPDGTITNVIFTSFPTGVTSVTIAGTPYTSANFPPTGVTATVGSPVSVDPTDPAPSVVIPFQVVDNAGVPSSNTATVTIPLTAVLVSVSGSVLDDGNGLTDATVNTTGTGALNPVNGTSLDGTPLYATLVNSGGSAVQTVAVTATGSYSFPGVSPGTYSVVLSTNPAGSTTASLPTSWTNVGENVGTGSGSDGTPNGILTGVTVGGTNVVNANFGIDKAPVVNPTTVTAQANPGGTNQAPVAPTAFTGSDQEDGTYPTNLTGRTVTLTPATNGTLYYNGTPVTSTTAITGFDPTKVTLDPTAPGATTGNDPTFTYAVADNAGVLSTPATVTVPFTAALVSVSGSVLDDGNGLTDGTVNTTGTGALSPVNGTSLDGTPLYATLVNSGGGAVQTVAVTATGSYSFPGVSPGTYSVVLSTNPAGSTTASLPTSWTNVGENVGTGSGSDGTPNGILTGVTVGGTNVVNANFGIDKAPVVNPATVTAQANPGGTNQAPVAPTAFTGSDQEDGTYPNNLTGREVTLSPATNGTLYYNGTPVTSTTAITGFDPTKVTLDPTAPGATTGNDPTFTYAVKDNAGVLSTPATVTVPFTAGIPDLVPIITALPATQYSTTNSTVVVDVYDLLPAASTGLITVYVSKDPMVNLTYDPNAVIVGGKSVQNSIWTFDGTSDPNAYIFTTTTVILGTNKKSFGMTGVLTPGNTRGTLTISSTIMGGSGGEVRTDNNSDADSIDYFKK